MRKAVKRSKSVDRTLLLDFTHYFAIMIELGMPVLRCLELLAKRFEKRNEPFSRVLRDIQSRISEGSKIRDAFYVHRDSFDDLFVGLVEAGEISSTLSTCLWKIYNLLGFVLELNRIVTAKKHKTFEFQGNVRAVLLCRLMSSLLSSGIPVMDCLHLASLAGDGAMRRAVNEIRDAVSEGKSLREGMTSYWKLTPELVEIVDIGETTGCLDKALELMAEFYQRKLGVKWIDRVDMNG